MTASEHLKGVAWRNTRGSFVVCGLILAIAAFLPASIYTAGCFAIVASYLVFLIGLWTAWFSVWAAEQTSAIESVELYEGTAQMQRRIIKQREEIKKLKKR